MTTLLAHGFFLAHDAREQVLMRPYPPIGLLSIAAYLKSAGHHVDVYDATFETFAGFEARCRERRPAVVGLSANLMTRRTVLRMIAVARDGGARVVLGGPDPSNYPAEYLAAGAHVVVIGEGELTFEALIRHLANHGAAPPADIPGLAYLDGAGAVVRTAARAHVDRLDDLPPPDRDAIDIEAYLSAWRQRHGYAAVSLITARGCPYTCAWCSHSVFGYSHRRRSPAHVADEVAAIVERYGPDRLWYADDVFTIHHRWLAQYADELDRRGLHLPFETISREDRISPSVVDLLVRLGCRRLWLGSESGSQRVLDAMSRGASAPRIREVVHMLQQRGIEVGLFVMLGYEGEEWADLRATAEHLKAAAADEFLTTVAYPIMGTPYHRAVEGRVRARTPWALGSDRELDVAGRRSRRYYAWATRWLVGEVTAHRLGRAGPRASLQRARAAVDAHVGRLGMWWYRNERVSDGEGAA